MNLKLKCTTQRIILLFLAWITWLCITGVIDTSVLTNIAIIDFQNPIITNNTTSTTNHIRFPASDWTENHGEEDHVPNVLSLHSDSSIDVVHLKYPPIPSVVGIGPEKCGTTSMAHALASNPLKIPEIIKPRDTPTGIEYEMRLWLPCGNANLVQTLENALRDGEPTKGENYCSLGWYQHFWTMPYNDIRFMSQHFNQSDLHRIFQRRQSTYFSNQSNDGFDTLNISDSLTSQSWRWRYYYYFEKSPAYWCYEHVAFLFHHLLVPQGTKFVVMIRDPIDRLYSFWSHQYDLKHIGSAFPEFVDSALNDVNILEIGKLLKDGERSLMDIQSELLVQWNAFVYSKERPYGYVGRRDENHGKRTQWRRKPKKGEMPKRRMIGWWRVNADSSEDIGLAASCYVVPLITIWLRYVPPSQIAVIQKEQIHGDENHAKFVRDMRCWMSIGYEYNTMEECVDGKRKEADVDEVHLTKSSFGSVDDESAKRLYEELYRHCNQRLIELFEIDTYREIVFYEMDWDLWHS